MKKRLILITIITLLLSDCKQKELDYLYSDKESLVNCSSGNIDLINEAVYTFEDYITNHYTFLGSTTPEGYHNYLELLFDNRPPAKEYFSEHLIKVVELLKAEENLWVFNGNKTRLNYKNELINCIIENIEDNNTKAILDALISSNTLSVNVLAPTLFEKKALMAKEDRALATYVALDMFYTKLIYMSSSDYVEESIKKDPSLDELDPNKIMKRKTKNKLEK
jgi:hypothetical protein